MSDVSISTPRHGEFLTAGAAKREAPRFETRGAGWLYLVIIVLGIVGEVAVRARLFVENDPVATAANIASSEALYRLSFVADSVMVLCDVALAVLLYQLFQPVNRGLSLMAMAFRLIQAAVLGSNLLHSHTALLVLKGDTFSSAEQVSSLVYHALDLHRHGYDLGLIFFGANCLLLGCLILRADNMPRFLGLLLIGAALTYFVGSYTRFLLPGAVSVVAPIYLVAVVAEIAFCAWLLVSNGRRQQTKLGEQS